MKDTFLIVAFWFLSIMGVVHFSHAFGMMQGQSIQKALDAEKLRNCIGLITKVDE